MRHHENGEHRTNEWKDVLIDALVVSFVYEAEHEHNPRKALDDLVKWEVSVALDPMVSREAAALIERGAMEGKAAHRNAAFINAIAEEGTKDEAVAFLQDTWNEHMALVKAARDLYYAAHWHADRTVDEVALWTALRDAAGLQPMQTAVTLGPDRTA